MESGKNVEQGTHSELLEMEGAYSALVKLQLEAGEGGGNGGEKKGKGVGGRSAAAGSSSLSPAAASPGSSSPSGVPEVSAAVSAAAAAAAASRAAEGIAAAGAASAAAEAAAASDAAPEHTLGWRRLWALSKDDWPSILVGVLGSAALGKGEKFQFFFRDEERGSFFSTLIDLNPYVSLC